MPMFEFSCQSADCQECGKIFEGYLRHWDDTNTPCEKCGVATGRHISGFAVVFTGVITAKYNDKGLDNSHADGHYAWRKNTSDGKPKLEFIETFQQAKDFAKAEGCINPKDIGPMEVGSDGKSVSSAGLPGCWV